MRTLALDPTTRGLSIRGGRLQFVEGADAVRQKLVMRLSVWRGDWFRDTRVGVPYLSFLGMKGDAAVALAETTLRRAIVTCAGVASLDRFVMTLGSDRRASVSFAVTTTKGEPVEVTDFIAEGN